MARDPHSNLEIVFKFKTLLVNVGLFVIKILSFVSFGWKVFDSKPFTLEYKFNFCLRRKECKSKATHTIGFWSLMKKCNTYEAYSWIQQSFLRVSNKMWVLGYMTISTFQNFLSNIPLDPHSWFKFRDWRRINPFSLLDVIPYVLEIPFLCQKLWEIITWHSIALFGKTLKCFPWFLKAQILKFMLTWSIKFKMFVKKELKISPSLSKMIYNVILLE